jgi:two-component system phosphate regulon response regulator OmpR
MFSRPPTCRSLFRTDRLARPLAFLAPDAHQLAKKGVAMKATGLPYICIPPRRAGNPTPSAVQPLDPLVLPHVPHVLHIDTDSAAAQALALLLMPEARVTHAATLAAARELLQKELFSAVVLEPELPDGDAAELLPALDGTPLLVYSIRQPAWRGRSGVFLPKSRTSPRMLWSTISRLLGISSPNCAGD